MAFSAVEPIGDQREDIRNALLLTVLINANRDPESEPAQIEKILPDWWGGGMREAKSAERAEDTWKANLQKIDMIAAALGVEPTRNGE